MRRSKSLDVTIFGALETKLNQVAAEVKSAEFNRQCLLASHTLRRLHHQASAVRWMRLQPERPRPEHLKFSYVPRPVTRHLRLYDGGTIDLFWGSPPLLRPSPIGPLEVDPFLYLYNLESLSAKYRPYWGWEFAQQAFFDYFSTLIDKVADYWREVVSAREIFKSFSIGTKLRQGIQTALRFKPLHTPVQIVPRSIHPIESVARVGC